MEKSRIGSVIMALPLLILVLALVIALYNAGFDLDAATLPENPTGPLEETLTSLLQTERPLVTGSEVDSDPVAGTVTLKGNVENPTVHPLTVKHLEYRIPGKNGVFTASLAASVVVPPGEVAAVELSGPAMPDVVSALESGTAEGVLSMEIEIMGISIITEMARPWEVGA